MSTSFKVEKIYLIILSVIFGIIIIARSYFFRNGFLSPDSSSYLLMAMNFSEHGVLYSTEFPNNTFPVWPPLYPILLSVVSFITSLDFFWASKLLNIIIFAIIISILYKRYRNKTYLFVLIFFLSTFNRIFTFSWSESTFILALFLFTTALYGNLTKTSIWNIAGLFFSCLGLFYSRWIGLFSLSLVISAAIFLRVTKKSSSKLFWIQILATLALFFLIILQLNYNKEITGFITGMPREWNTNSIGSKIFSILNGWYYELNLLVSRGGKASIILFAVQILIIGYFLLKKGSLKYDPSPKITFEKLLIFVGAVYICAIITVNFLFSFDTLDYRLLGPGTILIFFGLLGLSIENNLLDNNKWISLCLVIFAFISISIENTYYFFITQETKITYIENRNLIQKEFSVIEPRSEIIFPDPSYFNEYFHIKYLRPDLRIYIPSLTDTKGTMFQNIESNGKLYIVKKRENDLEGNYNYLEQKLYQPSLQYFLDSFPENKISLVTCD